MSHTAPDTTLDLGLVPVQVGARPAPSNAPLPDLLPMRVDVDGASGMVIQRRDPVVADTLARAYAVGAPLGTPLADHGLGKPGLDDFFGFILEARGGHGPAGARVLEIGSGEGALLAALADCGADAIGVEPGAAAAARARERGLTVLNDSFSRRSLAGRFDLVVHHAVLEHAEDPVGFLADQLSLLGEGGIIVCSVPDCTEPVARGDVSMLMHEHWSYFTAASLARVAYAAGAELVTQRPSRAAGALYSAWRPRLAGAPEPERCTLSAGFQERARVAIDRLRTWLERRAGADSRIGVYCPSRFLNYGATIGTSACAVRFFDDDPALSGMYLPPVDAPIETRADLIADPVDELLVMSWTFGSRLSQEVGREPALNRLKISTIDQVLGGHSS